MRRQLLIGLGVLLGTSASLAISRSGNGRVVSSEMGFSAEAPMMFQRSEDMGNGGLRLIAPFGAAGGGLKPAFLELRELPNEFPEFASLDRQGAEQLAQQYGWARESVADPCVEAFRSETGNAVMVLATWGQGKGVVVLGPSSETVEKAVQNVLRSIQLDNGACGWK